MAPKTELTLLFLEKEHPQVAHKIRTRLSELLPPYVFSDPRQVSELLPVFCTHRLVSESVLRGNGSQREVSLHRREFGAVMLLCFQPEKLLGLLERDTMKELGANIAKALDCHRTTVSNIMAEVPVHYKIYPDFRNTVNGVHQNIIEPYL